MIIIGVQAELKQVQMEAEVQRNEAKAIVNSIKKKNKNNLKSKDSLESENRPQTSIHVCRLQNEAMLVTS